MPLSLRAHRTNCSAPLEGLDCCLHGSCGGAGRGVSVVEERHSGDGGLGGRPIKFSDGSGWLEKVNQQADRPTLSIDVPDPQGRRGNHPHLPNRQDQEPGSSQHRPRVGVGRLCDHLEKSDKLFRTYRGHAQESDRAPARANLQRSAGEISAWVRQLLGQFGGFFNFQEEQPKGRRSCFGFRLRVKKPAGCSEVVGFTNALNAANIEKRPIIVRNIACQPTLECSSVRSPATWGAPTR